MTEKDEAEFREKYSAMLYHDERDIADVLSFITRKQQELIESILREIEKEYLADTDTMWEETKQLIRDKYGK